MIVVKTPFDAPFFPLCSDLHCYLFHRVILSIPLQTYISRIIMAKTFSQSDVATHKKPDDLWIIVDEDVYDMTKFQSEHPGKCTVDHDLLL